MDHFFTLNYRKNSYPLYEVHWDINPIRFVFPPFITVQIYKGWEGCYGHFQTSAYLMYTLTI